MKNLKIIRTPKTPEIDLNYETGMLTFRGRSIPENTAQFYESSIDWVSEYVQKPKLKTVVSIEYEYLNTASSKSLVKILTILAILSKNLNDITFNWSYEVGDEDMMDLANDLEGILEIKFNFIEEKF